MSISNQKGTARARAVIVAGPSGSGKTTVTRDLEKLLSDAVLIRSATTRPASKLEKDQRDYSFIRSNEEFLRLVNAGFFLEHALVYGSYYGTPKDSVDAVIKSGKIPIFEVDWQGARAIKEKLPFALSIYLEPPSVDALEYRLRNRGRDDAQIVKNRLKAAKDDLQHACEFDFVVKTVTPEQTAAAIIAKLKDCDMLSEDGLKQSVSKR